MKTSTCCIYSVSLCGLVVLESNQRSIINMAILVLCWSHPWLFKHDLHHTTAKVWDDCSGFGPLHLYFHTALPLCHVVASHSRSVSQDFPAMRMWCLRLNEWQSSRQKDTCVVAVEVVLLRVPHICWNCTLISAKVSMMTAINTFWKETQTTFSKHWRRRNLVIN